MSTEPNNQSLSQLVLNAGMEKQAFGRTQVVYRPDDLRGNVASMMWNRRGEVVAHPAIRASDFIASRAKRFGTSAMYTPVPNEGPALAGLGIGGVGGALGGAALGGPVGALAGALLGGVAGGVGGTILSKHLQYKRLEHLKAMGAAHQENPDAEFFPMMRVNPYVLPNSIRHVFGPSFVFDEKTVGSYTPEQLEAAKKKEKDLFSREAEQNAGLAGTDSNDSDNIGKIPRTP